VVRARARRRSGRGLQKGSRATPILPVHWTVFRNRQHPFPCLRRKCAPRRKESPAISTSSETTPRPSCRHRRCHVHAFRVGHGLDPIKRNFPAAIAAISQPTSHTLPEYLARGRNAARKWGEARVLWFDRAHAREFFFGRVTGLQIAGRWTHGRSDQFVSDAGRIAANSLKSCGFNPRETIPRDFTASRHDQVN
jgi:hypothetical protein